MKRFDVPDDTARREAIVAAGSVAPLDAEQRFAARVRCALDESVAALPEATLARLALARKSALRAQLLPERRRATASRFALAGGNTLDGSDRFGFGRASLVLSAIVLVGACLAGLYQIEQDRRVEELADMDTAVLNDDLPISAYADQGFNAFLKQNP